MISVSSQGRVIEKRKPLNWFHGTQRWKSISVMVKTLFPNWNQLWPSTWYGNVQSSTFIVPLFWLQNKCDCLLFSGYYQPSIKMYGASNVYCIFCWLIWVSYWIFETAGSQIWIEIAKLNLFLCSGEKDRCMCVCLYRCKTFAR